MILTTHSIIGAALAEHAPQGAVAFFIALASHYLFDMIPHWHYYVPEVRRAVLSPAGKKTFSFRAKFAPDVVRIAIDLSIGMALALFLFRGSLGVIALGALGAVLPDLLVGFAKLWPQRFLVWHDTFHRWLHTPVRLDDRPLIGIGSQAAIALFFVLFFR